MNKQRVNNYLPAAIKALGDCGIADKTTGVIIKTYRSNISGFGAAVPVDSISTRHHPRSVLHISRQES